MFMPNNDLDAKGGDVRRIGEIRLAKKVWRPRLFDARVPWVYAWRFADVDETNAFAVCALSEKLYQFGRGVDMAWAWGELLDESTLESRLTTYDGVVWRPGAGDAFLLACPQAGSLESLARRYLARRFRYEGGRRVFAQPPKPTCRQVSYEGARARHIFELRRSTDLEVRVVWPLAGASPLVAAVREAARTRLSTALPSSTDEIERYLVGHRSDGSNAAPAGTRVRLIPIPSIGTHYADRGIRRLLVEIPAACPIHNDDVRWALSGAELFDPQTGEVMDVLLSPTTNDDMLRHYGVGNSARVFRSVTPVVLPENTKRRRIEPTRRVAEAKRGFERVIETAGAMSAVIQALRHAGVIAPVNSIRVRREPFDAAGARVEPFAEGTRFEKERLWHVEIAFGAQVEGPLLIGDGRFLGLGLMAPAPDIVPGMHAFDIVDGLNGNPEPLDVARSLRRAVKARVRAVVNKGEPLDPGFTGHDEDDAPHRRSPSFHLAFAFDPQARLLLVLAPHVVERRSPTYQERKDLRTLDIALEGFHELRAGSAGSLTLLPRAISIHDDRSFFGPARVWENLTPYVVTRRARAMCAKEVLVADVHAECRRLRLPALRVESTSLRAVPATVPVEKVRLTFGRSVVGPLLLGKTRYLGGGLFRPVREPELP
jgi:CRISPR-associated protein Csb2